jgi:hypothetical protein
MRPTGIFASNTKVCLTKTPAYEKGKLKNTAALRVPQRTVRPEQIDFLTKQKTSIMDNISKTNNFNFSNKLISNN